MPFLSSWLVLIASATLHTLPSLLYKSLITLPNCHWHCGRLLLTMITITVKLRHTLHQLRPAFATNRVLPLPVSPNKSLITLPNCHWHCGRLLLTMITITVKLRHTLHQLRPAFAINRVLIKLSSWLVLIASATLHTLPSSLDKSLITLPNCHWHCGKLLLTMITIRVKLRHTLHQLRPAFAINRVLPLPVSPNKSLITLPNCHWHCGRLLLTMITITVKLRHTLHQLRPAFAINRVLIKLSSWLVLIASATLHTLPSSLDKSLITLPNCHWHCGKLLLTMITIRVKLRHTLHQLRPAFAINRVLPLPVSPNKSLITLPNCHWHCGRLLLTMITITVKLRHTLHQLRPAFAINRVLIKLSSWLVLIASATLHTLPSSLDKSLITLPNCHWHCGKLLLTMITIRVKLCHTLHQLRPAFAINRVLPLPVSPKLVNQVFYSKLGFSRKSSFPKTFPKGGSMAFLWSEVGLGCLDMIKSSWCSWHMVVCCSRLLPRLRGKCGAFRH